jgi:hypothetical protein
MGQRTRAFALREGWEMTIEINVTNDDILEGRKGHEGKNGSYLCTTCPIARAASRAFGGPMGVDGVEVWKRDNQTASWPLPREARDWVLDYDAKKDVKSFSFELNV